MRYEEMLHYHSICILMQGGRAVISMIIPTITNVNYLGIQIVSGVKRKKKENEKAMTYL